MFPDRYIAMTSPIPRNVLTHTATLKKRASVDARGKATYATGVSLFYVRIEKAKKNALTALGEQKNDSLILFYDLVNSYPLAQTFTPMDVVTYNGQDYTVRECVEEFSDMGTAHHYEVALT